MRPVRDAVVKLAAVLLVATASIGTIWAANHYYTLVVLETAMQSTRVLEDSFILMVKSKLLASDGKSDLGKAVQTEADQLTGVRKSVAETVSRIRRERLVDIALWVLVFVLSSAAALFSYRSAGSS